MKTKEIEPKLTMLRQVPYLRGKSDAELARLARLVDEVGVAAGRVLIKEGTAGRETFLIVDGWAEVSRDGVPIAAVGPGEMVGEMAMLDHAPRVATVTAKTPMRLLVLGPQTFGTFTGDPAVGRGMATLLAQRLRGIEERL